VRIFAAGIATETNTFSPVPTGLSDFVVQRGKDALAGRIVNPSLDLSAIWGKQAEARGDTFIFGLMALAQPFGTTVRAAYEALRDELLADLRAAAPVDVVLLMLHGAMVAEGYDDCEEDIIRRVRDIVGSETIIGVELDLHCHLSESMIAPADIVLTYKEYPHVDVNERARELFDLAVAARQGRIQPTMALFDCQLVGMYPTSREPLHTFVERMQAVERQPGVLSVSLGHGFQFADVPHVGAKVLVITDDDPSLARQLARQLGLEIYALRHEIGFASLSLPMEQAMTRALASSKAPIVIADQSDNVGGGAPGDGTFVLRWLLKHGVTDVATAIIYDPEVVKIARKAGAGAPLSVRLGGKLGTASGEPLDLRVTVRALRDDYMHRFPQQSGEPALFALGNVAALHCAGIDIIVASERCQCFCPSVFSDLGVDPRAKRLLIPKSYQHFYSAFAPLAAEVIYMAAPGAVPPDPRQIAYRRLNTSRLYPWCADPLASAS
jgi:microcystin degradation protein MlrC